jgi:flagellar basal body-associated protein FliL
MVRSCFRQKAGTGRFRKQDLSAGGIREMKKANLFVLLVALGVVAWGAPVANVHAVGQSAVLTSQQDEPAEPAEQETEAQTFTGQIMNHDGKYALHGDDGKTYQLDDQDKAKDFDGKKVKVVGTLDEESMTIHINQIEEVEA